MIVVGGDFDKPMAQVRGAGRGEGRALVRPAGAQVVADAFDEVGGQHEATVQEHRPLHHEDEGEEGEAPRSRVQLGKYRPQLDG